MRADELTPGDRIIVDGQVKTVSSVGLQVRTMFEEDGSVPSMFSPGATFDAAPQTLREKIEALSIGTDPVAPEELRTILVESNE